MRTKLGFKGCGDLTSVLDAKLRLPREHSLSSIAEDLVDLGDGQGLEDVDELKVDH